MFELSNLPKITIKSKKRVGRGEGSGRGKNAGKGHKGQNKHGKGVRMGFEGGQKSLLRRTPKFRGFKQAPRTDLKILNLGVLDRTYVEGEIVSLESLFQRGLTNKYTKNVRIIKSGFLTKNLKFAEDGSIYLTKGAKAVLS